MQRTFFYGEAHFWRIWKIHIQICVKSMIIWSLLTTIISIRPMALQPKSVFGLLDWGSMFYGVRLLASRPTPVNFGGPMIFCLGFTPLAKGSSFKALKTRPPSHSHLLHNPLCIAPGPPRGGWEFGFTGRACRLNKPQLYYPTKC
jgi:hypothetical protein